MASSSSPPPAVACVDQTEEFVDLFESVSIDEEDSELIDALRTLSKKSPKLVKSSDYKAPADPSTIVTSWKMNEFKYYDIPSPFPTLARGLFTQEIKRNKRMKYRIVARGYDKFFNIGEVPWTTVCSYAISRYGFGPVCACQCVLTDFSFSRVVEFVRGAYRRAVYSHTQVQRMHHLHCRTHFDEAPRHIKAFPWSECKRERSGKPRSGRGTMAPQAPRSRRQDRERARADALGQKLDCGSRGQIA